jgi:hypothetical protein
LLRAEENTLSATITRSADAGRACPSRHAHSPCNGHYKAAQNGRHHNSNFSFEFYRCDFLAVRAAIEDAGLGQRIAGAGWFNIQ